MPLNPREQNFQHAIDELLPLISRLADIQQLYLKPLRLGPELNATNRAIDYIGQTAARLQRRIDISKRMGKK